MYLDCLNLSKIFFGYYLAAFLCCSSTIHFSTRDDLLASSSICGMIKKCTEGLLFPLSSMRTLEISKIQTLDCLNWTDKINA